MSKSSILQSALATSLESLVEGEDGQEINPVTAETVVELDQVLEEVREAGDEVEGQEEAVETLSEAADSLESLIVGLESAIAAGGMSPQSADMYARGLKSAVRKLPVKANEYAVSVESFGGTTDKLVASQEALEGAKELLSKLWNGIVNAIKNGIAALKNFFAQIGKSGPAVVAAGKSLQQRAAATKGNAPSDFKVSGATAAALSIGKDFNPVKALEAVQSGYTIGVEQYGAKIRSSLMPLIQVVQAGEVTPQRLNEAAGKVDLKAAISDDMRGKLPNGYFFDLTLGAGAANGGSDLSILAKSSLKLSRAKGDAAGEATVGALTTADISKLGAEVVKVGQKIIASKSVSNAAEKGVNEIVSAGNKLVAKGGTLDKEEISGARSVLAQLNKAASLMTGCSRAYLSYMGSTAKAAVSFGSSYLKAMGGKKDEGAAA